MSTVLTVPFGRWKIKEAVEEGLREKFIRYAIQMTERNVQSLRKAVETSNGAVNQVIIIFDLSGYSFRQLMSRQSTYLLPIVLKVQNDNSLEAYTFPFSHIHLVRMDEAE
jgi:hypothetical protein